MQSREYELWSYRPNLKWGLILVPEPVAMQQVPAISFLLQASSVICLHFCGSYKLRFSEACALAQAEHEQGGPGRLSWQHDRRGADHPQGNPVALAQRHQDRAGELVCGQLRSHDRGFIDLIVDYDLSRACHRCGGIEVVGNLEISVFLHNKLAVSFIETNICGPLPDIRQRHRDT